MIKDQLLRLKWPLGIAVLTIVVLDIVGVDGTSRWALVLHKAAITTLAVLMADLITWSVFPQHLNLEAAAKGKDGGMAVGLIYMARCIVVAAIVLAFAWGV